MPKQSANTTHRKRLARRLAESTDLTYQQALDKVTAAANAGILPTPLDPAGMESALRMLSTNARILSQPTTAATANRVSPDTIECVYCGSALRYDGTASMWVRADLDVAAAIAAVGPHDDLHDVLGCEPDRRTGGLVAFVAAGWHHLRLLGEAAEEAGDRDAHVVEETRQALRTMLAADGTFTDNLRQWAQDVQTVCNNLARWSVEHRSEPLGGIAVTIADQFAYVLTDHYDDALHADEGDVDIVANDYHGTSGGYGHIPAPHWLRAAFQVASNTSVDLTRTDTVARETAEKVHKARPNEIGSHCAVCRQPVKRVPGGHGPTWIHTDSGAVAASGDDPAHPLSEQTEDTLAEDHKALPQYIGFAHEGNPVPRCTATSWRGGSGQRAGSGYGPGGFNRCVKRAGHESERHIDEWGNVFELDPKFRVVKNVTQGEVARVAAHAGIVLIDVEGNPIDPALLDDLYPYKAADPDDLAEQIRARLRPNLLVQTRTNEVLKISEIEKDSVTAQVVYPLPPRTTVRRYSYIDAATWREPSDVMVGKYERAWGFAD